MMSAGNKENAMSDDSMPDVYNAMETCMICGELFPNDMLEEYHFSDTSDRTILICDDCQFHRDNKVRS
jgi:hypothetical protein